MVSLVATVVKNCPKCKSKKVKGSIYLEEGNYVEILFCFHCDRESKIVLGTA